MHKYLHKALKRHCNEFFSMTEEEQIVFKLTDNVKLHKKIRKFVKKKIGVKGKINPPDQLLLNTILLPFQGIGPNDFMLNEFNWDEDILKFKDLYEYNIEAHEFQETSNVRDFSEYISKPLFNRFNDWARASINDKFYYMNVLSYQIWLYYASEDASFNWFEDNIPYDYVDGKDHGKEVEGGLLWDMVLDADGNEGYHEHMSEFSRKWINARYDEDLANDQFGNNVFVIDKTDDILDPSLDYIFGSVDVLRELTFLNFINDCEKVRGNPTELLEFEVERKNDFSEAMDSEFAKIQSKPSSDFESRAQKKRKRDLIIAPGALDELQE